MTTALQITVIDREIREMEGRLARLKAELRQLESGTLEIFGIKVVVDPTLPPDTIRILP